MPLALFVLGVPSYGQRFGSATSAASRERFYRLLRACYAVQGRDRMRRNLLRMRQKGQTRLGRGGQGHRLRFGQAQWSGEGHADPGACRISIMREIDAHTREGTLYYTDQWQAYATLKMRGEHVMIRKEKG